MTIEKKDVKKERKEKSTFLGTLWGTRHRDIVHAELFQ